MPRKLFVWKMECDSQLLLTFGRDWFGRIPEEVPKPNHMECKVPNQKEIGIKV